MVLMTATSELSYPTKETFQITHFSLFQINGSQSQIDGMHIRSFSCVVQRSLVAVSCFLGSACQEIKMSHQTPRVWVLFNRKYTYIRDLFFGHALIKLLILHSWSYMQTFDKTAVNSNHSVYGTRRVDFSSLFTNNKKYFRKREQRN